MGAMMWLFDQFLPSRRPGAPVIKLDFCDFWDGFSKSENYLTDLLLRQFSIQITSHPDYLIYSNFGQRHLSYKCVKIFYTGENIRPDFNECDYAFTFDHLPQEPRHYRLPLYAWWDDAENLVKPPHKDLRVVLDRKTRFCNFIYGNGEAKRRLEFMQALSKYKSVDSAGTLMNNVGHTVSVFEKVNFLKSYKFTIAFENTEQPGYTTEKLVQPMLADSIPIYWGNPLVNLDFNSRSFVNMYDFASDKEAIDHIIDLDQDDGKYMEMLSQPFYHGNRINTYVDPDNILGKFADIFQKARSPVRIKHMALRE
jgi:hypothetical protein